LSAPSAWPQGGDAPAFLGATPAGFRALPTVLHLGVLGAFLRACLAYVGARFTDRLSELAPPRHVRRRHPADLGTVHIERDAARHALHIALA
jgi:hypothetical protein